MTRFFLPLFLFLSSLWLGWTVLVDFIVVPAVFRNVSHFFEAGRLGIELFTQLNRLEIVVSLLLAVLTFKRYKKDRSYLPLVLVTVAASIIVAIYLFYLSPKIATLTDLWQSSEQKGWAGQQGILDVQQEHQFYHRVYIAMDSVKIFLLSLSILFVGLKKESKA